MDETTMNRCVNCGRDTDGSSAVYSKDHDGNEIKWTLCNEGPSPTCFEKWTVSIPRSEVQQPNYADKSYWELLSFAREKLGDGFVEALDASVDDLVDTAVYETEMGDEL